MDGGVSPPAYAILGTLRSLVVHHTRESQYVNSMSYLYLCVNRTTYLTTVTVRSGTTSAVVFCSNNDVITQPHCVLLLSIDSGRRHNTTTILSPITSHPQQHPPSNSASVLPPQCHWPTPGTPTKGNTGGTRQSSSANASGTFSRRVCRQLGPRHQAPPSRHAHAAPDAADAADGLAI